MTDCRLLISVVSVAMLAAVSLATCFTFAAESLDAAKTFKQALAQSDRNRAAELIRQAIAIERKQQGDTLQFANYQAALCSFIEDKAQAGALFGQVYAIRKAKAPSDTRLLNETAAKFFSQYPSDPSTMLKVAHDWVSRIEKGRARERADAAAAVARDNELYSALQIILAWSDAHYTTAEVLPFLKKAADMQRARESKKPRHLVDDSHSRRLADLYVVLKMYREAVPLCDYCLKNNHSAYETATLLMNLGDANANLGRKQLAKQNYDQATKLWQSPDISQRHLKFLTKNGFTAEAQKVRDSMKKKNTAREQAMEAVVTADKLARLKPEVLRAYRSFKGYNQFAIGFFADANRDGVVSTDELKRFTDRKSEQISAFDPEAEIGLVMVSQELAKSKVPLTRELIKQTEERSLQDMVALAVALGSVDVPHKAIVIETLTDRFTDDKDAVRFVTGVNELLKQRKTAQTIAIGATSGGNRLFTVTSDGKAKKQFSIPSHN